MEISTEDIGRGYRPRISDEAAVSKKDIERVYRVQCSTRYRSCIMYIHDIDQPINMYHIDMYLVRMHIRYNDTCILFRSVSAYLVNYQIHGRISGDRTHARTDNIETSDILGVSKKKSLRCDIQHQRVNGSIHTVRWAPLLLLV